MRHQVVSLLAQGLVAAKPLHVNWSLGIYFTEIVINEILQGNCSKKIRPHDLGLNALTFDRILPQWAILQAVYESMVEILLHFNLLRL